MLYRPIEMWARSENGRAIVCFRCLELLTDPPSFCVQSADFYQNTDDRKKSERNLSEFHAQFVELLGSEAPEKRSATYSTLREAVLMFAREFGVSGVTL